MFARLTVLVGIFLVQIASPGEAMAFGSVVICPSFNGKLVQSDGTPATGVTVQREWRWGWKDETGTDNTVSDGEGNFAFKAVSQFSLMASLLPHEPRITETVRIRTDQGELTIFERGINDYVGDDPGSQKVCYVDREPKWTGDTYGTCEDAP